MIIVSWNCNGALRTKLAALESLLPDICVVQECEDPARSTSATYREWAANSLWIGGNKNRGLGIFAKSHIRLEPVAWDANGLETFLPCRINGSTLLLGVWTKQSTSYDYRYIGQLWKYVALHREALSRQAAIVIGDLNSNVIWDKPRAVASHSKVVSALSDIGLESIYHHAHSMPQGKERDPTLFLQRNLLKPYHIDYAFLPREWLPTSSIEIGRHETWLGYSDHMPVRVEVGALL
jgi:exonuclease III